MTEPKDRLKQIRMDRGFKTATAAAKRFGWSVDTYRSHENGVRDISRKAAVMYAKAFKVPSGWLLYGEGKPNLGRTTANAAGYVGAGLEIVPFDDHAVGEGIAEVDIPPGTPPDAVPVIVRGDSMYPRYFDGEVLFYVRNGRTPEELVGQECVVKLKDGRMLVKVIRPGTKKHRFHLISWNAPILENEAIEWAGEVRWRGKV